MHAQRPQKDGLPYYLETGLSLNVALSWFTAPPVSALCYSVWALQVCAGPHPASYMGSRGLNSGLHVYAAGTLTF